MEEQAFDMCYSSDVNVSQAYPLSQFTMRVPDSGNSFLETTPTNNRKSSPCLRACFRPDVPYGSVTMPELLPDWLAKESEIPKAI